MIKKFALAAILLLAVMMATVLVANAGMGKNARTGKHALVGMAACMGATLTDEQRAAIQEKVTEMKDAGASRREIREAIAEMLAEYGIEVPDEWFYRLGKGYYLCADLTDEQRTAIKEKVAEMKEAGASRQEIREAVAEMLKEYGIELPAWSIYLGKCYLCSDLTDEQRTAIEEKVAEMKEAGASSDEIRDAIVEMLKEYGIEVPALFGYLRKACRLWTDLTDEQRAAIEEKVTEMEEAGASRDEIRDAIIEMLAEYGIEVPDRRSINQGKFGQRNGMRGAYNRTNRRANLLATADLAMIDAQIAAAPQATPQKISKIATWGKLKASR